MVFFGLAALLIISLYILPGLPNIETLKDIKMQVPLRIYTADMSLIISIISRDYLILLPQFFRKSLYCYSSQNNFM